MIGVLEFALAQDKNHRSFNEQIIRVGYLSKTTKEDEIYYTLAATEHLIMVERGAGGPTVIGVKIGWIQQGERWPGGSSGASRRFGAIADIFISLDSSTGAATYIAGEVKWLKEDDDVVYGDPY